MSRTLIPLGILGWDVVEEPTMRYDLITYDRNARVVITGSIAHVTYRIQMIHLNNQARRAVEEILDNFANSVGVDRSPTSH